MRQDSEQTKLEPSETEGSLEHIFGQYVEHHIIDKEPETRGNKKLARDLSGSLFGCKGVEIDRCVPNMEISRLKLEPGKQLVLIGPNGGGKTTIFDAIMEIKSASFNDRNAQGASITGKSTRNREKMRISRLNQEEMLAGLGEFEVNKILAHAEQKFSSEFEVNWEEPDEAMQNDQCRQRIEELRSKLDKLFGIQEFYNRKVNELSGGEKTKLSLCMVLLSEPDILLLDEPTNHLDLESLAKLSGLLDSYANTGVSILSVSHVDSYLEQAGKNGVAEITVDKKSRQVTTSGSPYRDFMKDRARQEFTIIDGKIQWPERKSQTSGALISPIQEKVSIPDSPLKDITPPSLLPGEVWVLSGNNGSGKTKLMEALASREKGRGIFDRSKGTSLAYLPQFWPENVGQGNLEDFFQWVKDNTDPKTEIGSTKFLDAIKKIGFKNAEVSQGKGNSNNLLKKKLASFSGGEQRLLWFLAVSCFQNVDALLLDEPTNHMDKNLQQAITQAIQDFPGSVVFSTHDIKLLQNISDDVGNKGSTLAPKNLVLTKEKGLTKLSESKENPFDYVQSRLTKAKNSGSRVQI
jgi:ATP-binding cassette subfamily F protein 3